MDTSTLAARLGTRHSPLILDVRKQAAFDGASSMIAGALRLEPGAVTQTLPPALSALLSSCADLVVYCVHGHEVSQGACATLKALGYHAEFLVGGIAEWDAQHLPIMTKAPALGLPAQAGRPSRWVTRERPKIDRIACPWLIRRFIDPSAQFLYVPASLVMETAKKESAIPYDVPKVQISHRGDEGERCSFDALVDDCGLTDPCLHQLAKTVRGADTGKPELTPESAGLLAVSLGLSAAYPNDHEMLEQGMVVYDALYAWIKSARGEVHNAQLFRKV